MIKGDLFADIFDSPQSIAQARREGYSLVDPEDIEKIGGDLDELTKSELLELARQKGILEKSLSQHKKSEIIELIKAAAPVDAEPPKAGEAPNDPNAGKPPEPAGNQDAGETPAAGGAGNEGPAGGNGGTGEAQKEKHGFFGGGRK
jgi:hypothetical protein